jgi:hypothetical protein
MDDRAPLEARALLAMPLHHPEQLLAQCFDHQRGLHGFTPVKVAPNGEYRPALAGLCISRANPARRRAAQYAADHRPDGVAAITYAGL